MEINKLVKRSVYDTFPPTVEYVITDHGRTLKKVVDVLAKWGVEHREKIIGKKQTAPLGPWKNSRTDGIPLVAYNDFKNINIHNIDPDCFIDDDGVAYLYWGSGYKWINGRCLAAKLTKDMNAFESSPVEVTPKHYFEGPLMIKRNGRYYLMFSEGKAIDETYQVGYAVGNTPFGPFKEGANSPILKTIPGTPVIGPGHHTVFREKEQDYILYHRIYPQNKSYVLRQLCVDSLKFDTDGNIRRVTPNGISTFK